MIKIQYFVNLDNNVKDILWRRRILDPGHEIRVHYTNVKHITLFVDEEIATIIKLRYPNAILCNLHSSDA